MKKLMLLMVVVVAVANLAGCNTCRRMGGWFTRGDECAPAPSICPPGGSRATMMYPQGPAVLPGPFEIAPAN
ncbi:MAG: hypothetical protein WD872_14345 [Pirellulaceae bacterium]